jgi:hypothetical protein
MLLKELVRENPDTLIKIYNDDVLMAYDVGEMILDNMDKYWLNHPVDEITLDDGLIKVVIY